MLEEGITHKNAIFFPFFQFPLIFTFHIRWDFFLLAWGLKLCFSKSKLIFRVNYCRAKGCHCTTSVLTLNHNFDNKISLSSVKFENLMHQRIVLNFQMFAIKFLPWKYDVGKSIILANDILYIKKEQILCYNII